MVTARERNQWQQKMRERTITGKYLRFIPRILNGIIHFVKLSKYVLKYPIN